MNTAELMSTKEACEFLHCTRRTLYNYTHKAVEPLRCVWMKNGNYYRRTDLQKCITIKY